PPPPPDRAGRSRVRGDPLGPSLGRGPDGDLRAAAAARAQPSARCDPDAFRRRGGPARSRTSDQGSAVARRQAGGRLTSGRVRGLTLVVPAHDEARPPPPPPGAGCSALPGPA